jgi:hypothetical protein
MAKEEPDFPRRVKMGWIDFDMENWDRLAAIGAVW